MTRSSEFRRVRVAGRSAGGKFLVLAVSPAPEGTAAASAKFGFVTSRRVGGAVVRNRVRRRLRAVVREVGVAVPGGRMVVTIARPAAAGAAFAELRSEWLTLGRRLGVLEREAREPDGGPGRGPRPAGRRDAGPAGGRDARGS
jgi:ribonuclease P protein component